MLVGLAVSVTVDIGLLDHLKSTNRFLLALMCWSPAIASQPENQPILVPISDLCTSVSRHDCRSVQKQSCIRLMVKRQLDKIINGKNEIASLILASMGTNFVYMQ